MEFLVLQNAGEGAEHITIPAVHGTMFFIRCTPYFVARRQGGIYIETAVWPGCRTVLQYTDDIARNIAQRQQEIEHLAAQNTRGELSRDLTSAKQTLFDQLQSLFDVHTLPCTVEFRQLLLRPGAVVTPAPTFLDETPFPLGAIFQSCMLVQENGGASHGTTGMASSSSLPTLLPFAEGAHALAASVSDPGGSFMELFPCASPRADATPLPACPLHPSRQDGGPPLSFSEAFEEVRRHTHVAGDGNEEGHTLPREVPPRCNGCWPFLYGGEFRLVKLVGHKGARPVWRGESAVSLDKHPSSREHIEYLLRRSSPAALLHQALENHTHPFPYAAWQLAWCAHIQGAPGAAFCAATLLRKRLGTKNVTQEDVPYHGHVMKVFDLLCRAAAAPAPTLDTMLAYLRQVGYVYGLTLAELGRYRARHFILDVAWQAWRGTQSIVTGPRTFPGSANISASWHALVQASEEGARSGCALSLHLRGALSMFAGKESEARDAWLEACALGFAPSLAQIAQLHSQRHEFPDAVASFAIALKLGFPPAADYVGRMILEGRVTHEVARRHGWPTSPEERQSWAHALLRDAALVGIPQALCWQDSAPTDARGTASRIGSSNSSSRTLSYAPPDLLCRAAANSYPPALLELAHCYRAGARGCTQNQAHARVLELRAEVASLESLNPMSHLDGAMRWIFIT